MSRVLLALLVLLAVQCTPPETPDGSLVPQDLPRKMAAALVAEGRDALDPGPMLAVVEQALYQSDDPWALAALLAALDALVWREVDGVGGIEHAIAHRSRDGLVKTAGRLRRAHRSGAGTPLMRGAIADALHDLALRVGAVADAQRWRHRTGCVQRAAVLGPLAWPALTALDGAAQIRATAPMPASLPGVPPFAPTAEAETAIADACIISTDESSPLAGLRLVVVDVVNPREQDLYLALSTASAARLEIGGKVAIERAFAAGGEWVTRFGRVHAEAGRLRVVARVAHHHDGGRIAIQIFDDKGEPVTTAVPRPGERADARATTADAIEVAPAGDAAPMLTTAVAARLAVGEGRQAVNHLERATAKAKLATPELELLSIRALKAAGHLPQNQLLMQVVPAAARARAGCPECWEARIYEAAFEEDQKGQGTGVYAGLAKLGVSARDDAWTQDLGPMELTYVALRADAAGLDDVARQGFDALAAKVPGSLMVADLDARLYTRSGDDLVKAACVGGTSRATTRCLSAHIERSDLRSALKEMERLRQLRGSQAILRHEEIAQLLAHGQDQEAMLIYDALPPGRRDLGLLGLYVGTREQSTGKQLFAADMLRASGIPQAFEPLVRLLGVMEDPSADLEKRAAALVKEDRAAAFLPGAGTAVLRRLEDYHLHQSGLLHFWLYDLRRVSGTTDVEAGTSAGAPMVEGRTSTRTLRRRIYKKDGRVIDPDPSAEGAQGHTDLSQLQSGDYVEVLTVGWALPDDDGQLTVDTPDLLPPRTSIREGRVAFSRPASIPLKLWSHALLGEGAEHTRKGNRVTEWRLKNQAPRRLEQGVPRLESRVALSFGTDSYERIALALAARHRSLDEKDPFMGTWVKKALGGEDLASDRQVARVVAAVGKVVKRPDAGVLGDWGASLSGGPQRETARWILEQGVGSRTWVVHRAMRELGLSSEIAVAETRPFSAAPGFPPHTGRFTHPLVRVTIGNETLWIDADVDGPPLPPGRISPELRGRQALLPSGKMVTVEAKSSVDVDEISINLTLANDGNATGTFSISLHGGAAQALADALEVIVGSERDQMLRSVVLAWIPWADVIDVTLKSDEGSWEVALSAKIAVASLAIPQERDRPVYALPGMTPVHIVHPHPSSTTLGARYTAQGGRKTALSIDQPLLYHVRRRITLPAGATVIALPPAVDLDKPYLAASRTVAQEGTVITDDYRLNLPVGTIAAEAFDAFATDVQTVDDGFLHTTRIELPKKP